MKNGRATPAKVIEFPKNKQYEANKCNDKLEVAYQFLQSLINRGGEFHILISHKDAEKLFDGDIKDFTVITSNLDELEHSNYFLLKNNFSVYQLEGDELD